MQSRYVRIHGTRQQQLDRLRAKGWQVVTFKSAPVVAAFETTARGVSVKAWRGKADKPDLNNLFHSLRQAEGYVNSYVGRVAQAQETKANRAAAQLAKRAALKASDHWTEGDVFSNMWGYDQTNIDWYQIVEVKAKSVVIRAINKNYKETGFMSGNSQPRRNDFCGEPMVKQLDEAGRISMRHGCATKWDGKPAHETHYA